MPRVLLLIPTASYRAPDFMRAADRLGVEVIVGSDQRHPLEGAGDGSQIALDFLDVERGTDQVEALAERFPIDAIIAVDDAGTRLAAAASRRLELPHNPVGAVEATRNKALMRRRLAASGVTSPAFATVALTQDPRPPAEVVGYPLVLKPLSLSGSRGVIRADNEEELLSAFERVSAILGDPAVARECGDLANQVLLESFIPGREVSLEGILTSGRLRLLALFDKPDPLDGPFFEETIYVTPSRLEPADQELVLRTAADACRALGLSDGPLHAELRVNDGGAFPIDIAARSIGGLCSRTLTFGTGLSLEEIILRHSLGESVPVESGTGAAGVMMIPIPARGVLRRVTGVEEAEAIEHVDAVTLTARKGMHLVPLPEGSEYLGFIFAHGPTPEEVSSALRAAHERLRFEID